MKRCSKCKKVKEQGEFYKILSRKDDLRSECKNCTKQRAKRYESSHHEERRKYRTEHRVRRRDYLFRWKYNISSKDVESMYAKQGGNCLICHKTMILGGSNGTAACVDHIKGTKTVRGMLCNHCNRGLGNFFDNTESLKNAISYLQSYEGIYNQ